MNETPEQEIKRLRDECIRLSRVISRIDYELGPANDMECSLYDVDVDEERVLKAVTVLKDSAVAMTKAEHALSDAYLRIRRLVNAFDTPFAPTAEQVWGLTEQKVAVVAKKAVLADQQAEFIELEEKSKNSKPTRWERVWIRKYHTLTTPATEANAAGTQ